MGKRNRRGIKPVVKVVPASNPPPEPPEPPVTVDPGEKFAAEIRKESQEKGVSTVKKPAKQGDLLDGMIAAQNSAGMEKMNGMNAIREKIEKKLCVNPDSKQWNSFIEFAYGRQKKNGESIEKFMDWAIENNFQAVYWPPEKMRTLWPQAFVENKANLPLEDFVAPLPPRREEVEVAPMPKDIGRKRELF